MNEFVMIFRNELNPPIKSSPEQMQEILQHWADWLGGISAANKLVSRGNRLADEGKIVKGSNVVMDGPFAETKEIVCGYIVVRSDSFEEAVETAKACPIIKMGGFVEVRSIIALQK